MARQWEAKQNPPAIGPALCGFALVIFWMDLAENASRALCHLFCAILGIFLQALPGLLVTALQGLESWASSNDWLLTCVQWLACISPIVRWLVGAA